MTYNKPEVVKLDSALSTIQGQHKGTVQADAPPKSNEASIAAYEADE